VTQAEKLLARMRNNPRNWTIGDLKSLAKRYGFDWRQPGTSHVTFSRLGRQPLTVPAHKPIKSIHVIRLIALIDSLRESEIGGKNDG
jgi:hypothetical protein